MDNMWLGNTVAGVGERNTGVDGHSGPESLESARLTIVHPFYNEYARFKLQYANWLGWSDEVRERVNVVLIDDGSASPIHELFTSRRIAKLGNFNISVHRIEKDLKWNTPGALNLGLTVAPTDWVLIMDSDCAFDNENMEKLLKAAPDPNAIYKFPRQRLGSGAVRTENLTKKRWLPCTMLFHRSLFMDKVGGFDEDYTGEYSGGYAFFDTDFDERAFSMHNEHPMLIWNDVTAIEWMPSMADGEIVHRSIEDQNVNKRLLYEKRAIRMETGDVRNPSPILRFKHSKVYEQCR
jgi:glycosyltransferase involved in cell wall biosynthesis